MIDIIRSHPELARKEVDKYVPLFREKETNFFQGICSRVMTNTQEYVQFIQETDFGHAPVFNEASGIPYTSFELVNKKTFQPVKRGLGYQASVEKFATDQAGIATTQKMSSKLARSLNKTEEAVAADLINQAFTNTAAYQGPDGAPLSTSVGDGGAGGHPLDVGLGNNRGVRSGSTWIDVAFGSLAVEQALVELMETQSHRGDPMPMTGPFRLMVPPALEGPANRVLKAKLLAGTSDNDPNWAKSRISEQVLVNPYFTSRSQWSLRSVSDDEHGLFKLQRRGTDTDMWEDKDRQVVKMAMTALYIYSFWDWRGFWSTSGTVSS